VAELVDGRSLADRLRGGPLAPAEALDLAEQLCSALREAHAQRVVHRDIKPGNVLITRQRRIKVADFGVARLAEGTSGGPAATIMGTPRYMAPEQARGHTPTPATDVYAAGVVLYEMLAGSPPFAEGSAVELALRHIEDPPPPLPDAVPPALAEIVERALAKDPAERYPSGREMGEALAAARAAVSPRLAAAPGMGTPRATPPTRVAPRRNPRRNVNPAESRRYRALLGAVLLILLGVVMAVVLTGGASVRVPSLRGLGSAAARAKLNHLQLRARFSRRYSSAPVGAVVEQQPVARSLLADGGTVHLIVSAGPPPVPVPQLVGQRSADAQAILSRLGLTATTVQVPAPGVTPGLVVQQSTNGKVRAHSRIRLSVAETPRWRPLTSFSGGQSVPFRIRGTRWRIVYSMGYDGICSLVFICSGPSAQVTNVTTGAPVSHFDLNEGGGQTQVLSAGPGIYRISVSPGSDSAHWSVSVQDDY
jgi:serine/threonine-protein kinase